ncbi:MAG TPA: nitrophenyl compound nitroreductase subunit ArsF family protein [Phycisphaerae bacterium]|nr:nitrophenyl compound nitroreductase subunit ArsF family protein [Phycisphaerae bacterium]
MQYREQSKSPPADENTRTAGFRGSLIRTAALSALAGLALLLGGACNKPSTSTTDGPGASGKAEPKFIAYYFHRTLRCPTCLSIEKQSKETVESRFGGPLHDGTLAWRAVNIESDGNGHFEQDFQLQAQALILVELKDGKVARWKNLPKVWELVDKPHEFQEYVRSELAQFMES